MSLFHHPGRTYELRVWVEQTSRNETNPQAACRIFIKLELIHKGAYTHVHGAPPLSSLSVLWRRESEREWIAACHS